MSEGHNTEQRPGSGQTTADAQGDTVHPESPQHNGSADAEQGAGADWQRIPALAAYINRVGAEARNFRRFVVKQRGPNNYFHDKAVIKIVDGNRVECSDEEYATTEAEAAAITAALAGVTWPTSVTASEAKLRYLRALLKKKHNGQDPQLFVFRDESGNGVLFVQERVRGKDGGKSDLPWSFWSDGQWRNMEPDGKLPLYGLEKLRDAATVVVHEGAKAAQHVSAIFKDNDYDALKIREAHPWLADFPWRGSLVDGATHIGWPGGSLNAHRVDWSPLRRLSAHVNIILVLDNDFSGEQAGPAISRQLLRRCSVLRFGSAFPRGFDMADKFPDALWQEKNGRRFYKGPSFMDCLAPATWATVKVGKGYRLRDEFIEEWSCVLTPSVFIHRSRPDRRYLEKEFNALCGPYSDTANVADMLRRSQWAQADGLVYEPSEPPGRIAFGRRQVINAYEPSNIKPVAGDVGPWLEFMEHLIPEEADRHNLLKWAATLIARPEVRMKYSVLLISERQGIGKSTLGETILAPLVGLQNCSFPSTEEISSQYTSWCIFKRLAVIGELYGGSSSKTYNRLKTLLADQQINANEKYLSSYRVNNRLHIFASSNSMRALKFDDSDRRWLVPGVTEKTKPFVWWKNLNDWLQAGGLAHISHWAGDFVRQHGHVQSGEHAPASARKSEVIRQSMSDGERYVAELGDAIKVMAMATENRPPAKVVVRLDEVRTWLRGKKAADPTQYGEDGSQFLERPETISRVLRGCGLVIPKTQFRDGDLRFRVAANFEVPSSAEWADLAPLCRAPATLELWD